MEREDIEGLVGESMEDMGLVEQVESRECECCGHLIEEDSNSFCFCIRCAIEYPYCHHK